MLDGNSFDENLCGSSEFLLEKLLKCKVGKLVANY